MSDAPSTATQDPPRELDTLYHELRPRDADESPGLQIAILHALGQIGDRRAGPYVKRLAELRARTPNQQRVQAAARVCLLSLP